MQLPSEHMSLLMRRGFWPLLKGFNYFCDPTGPPRRLGNYISWFWFSNTPSKQINPTANYLTSFFYITSPQKNSMHEITFCIHYVYLMFIYKLMHNYNKFTQTESNNYGMSMIAHCLTNHAGCMLNCSLFQSTFSAGAATSYNVHIQSHHIHVHVICAPS